MSDDKFSWVYDSSGSKRVYNLRFSVNDNFYSIQLTEEAYRRFLEDMDPWMQSAELMDVVDVYTQLRHDWMRKMKKVRVWAEENGIEVGARGRVPEDILVMYENSQENSS